jgi:ubiquinone/menaquinone biosynthesis C-methylase UbiE
VLSYYIYKQGHNVYGIDNSKEAILYAKKKLSKYPINFQVGDVYELPYPDNYFDFSCSTEVIEHLNHPDDFLKELKRVTKPEGKIIITTPIKNTKIPQDKMHFQEWFIEDYKSLILKSFSNSEFKYSHPIFWKEIYSSRFRFKFFLNLLSLVGYNVFSGFTSSFNTKTLQFSISRK